MKFDFDRGTSETWELEPGWTTGECVFAPRIDAQGEDDGYCIAMISDQTGRKSELVILDAQAISKGPIARITIPQRVPNGFHANWIPAKDYR